MKIKIGGSISYRIQMGAYEPGEVGSSIEIEKDIGEVNDAELEAICAELYQKVERLNDADIKNKMIKAVHRYKEIKQLV